MVRATSLRNFASILWAESKGKFSPRAAEALYDWLCSGTETKKTIFDMQSLCCEFAEYDSLYEAAEAHGINYRQLGESTTVIQIPGGGVLTSWANSDPDWDR